MQNFDLCLPTKVLFGEGRIQEIGRVAGELGSRAMLLTYDEAAVAQIGVLPSILGSLDNAGVKTISFFGVKSNPTVEFANRAIEVVKREKLDLIIALGGGSVIDSAKCVAVGAFYDGDVWELYERKTEVTGALPIIAVVTMPASSSEMNCGSVMNNERSEQKQGLGHTLMFPKVSILDPELTYGIPKKLTAYSAIDIVSHLLEAYLSHTEEFAPMQNYYCEAMVKTIMECMERIVRDPKDKDARATFMWTATYAWNGFYRSGLGAFDEPIHIIGHVFSAFYDTPHGAAMAITMPAVMRYNIDGRLSRYAQLARNVFEITDKDDRRAADKGLKKLVKWIEQFGVATNMRDAGIPLDRLDEMAKNVYETAIKIGYGHFYTLNTCIALLRLCM